MTSRRETAISVALVALFFVVRFVLLVVREPFFDELFTLWLAGKPLSGIIPALQLDSGPPLYYFLARFPDVFALRVESLMFATAALGIVLTRSSLGSGRYLAALLLALHPPAALFAVDARAYALCALGVAGGVVALRERRPFLATVALLLAAYAHYYGALFLPLLLLVRPWRKMFVSVAVAAVAFAPALFFASRQPPEAMRWLGEQNPFAALGAFAFAGNYAESLFAAAPLAVVVLTTVVVLIVLIRTDRESALFGAAVLLPIGLAIVIALIWRPVYFPMRFESVLAVPLALWLGTALMKWRPPVRYALAGLLALAGAGVIARGAIEHAGRPGDPYLAAARRAVELSGGERVVASGYLVLPMLVAGNPFDSAPAEQALHPGWRAVAEPSRTLLALPRTPFIWAGEKNSPETVALARTRRFTPLYVNEVAVVARVGD